MPHKNPPSTSYNCAKCPGYCCTYPRICVTKRDIKRLAEHFNLSLKIATERFTKAGFEKNEVILRHRPDEHFETACPFLHPEKRRCTIYEVRPTACREFPGTRRCGYYDFLTFERRVQDDPEHIAVTNNTE